MIRAKTFVTSTECPDCETVNAIMAEIQQLPIDVQFEIIDILNNPELAANYNIETVPTVVICNDVITKYTLVGVAIKQEYINSIGLA